MEKMERKIDGEDLDPFEPKRYFLMSFT